MEVLNERYFCKRPNEYGNECSMNIRIWFRIFLNIQSFSSEKAICSLSVIGMACVRRTFQFDPECSMDVGYFEHSFCQRPSQRGKERSIKI